MGMASERKRLYRHRLETLIDDEIAGRRVILYDATGKPIFEGSDLWIAGKLRCAGLHGSYWPSTLTACQMMKYQLH